MTSTGVHAHDHACASGRPPAPPTPRALPVAVTRSSAVTILAALAGLSVWVLVRNPLHNTVFPPCPLRAATGLWCPGCGATRASYLLLQGDLPGALHFNGLWVVLAPFVLYQAVSFAAEAFGIRWLKRIPLTQPVIVALLVSLGGFFVLRNLPLDAVEVLNPLTAL